MTLKDSFAMVLEVQKKFIDEESRRLYDARLQYLIDDDFYKLADSFFDSDNMWNLWEVDQVVAVNPSIKRFVIWGCNAEGIYTRKLLENSIYQNEEILYCDDNPEAYEGQYDGKPVIATGELMGKYNDSILIIANAINPLGYLDRIQYMLFPLSKVICPRGLYQWHIYGVTGNQYFDYFEANKK